jgi:uncharacterized protein YhfF
VSLRDPIDSRWRQYLQDSGQAASGLTPYPTDSFGDSPALADELGGLVVAGTKTATCSALWEWEAEKSPPPAAGDRTIILDGAGQPLCIIETVGIEIRPFEDVDESFAYDEGEEDRTLTSWRLEHWKYFSRVLPKIGRNPAQDMPLVCERFRLVYAW